MNVRRLAAVVGTLLSATGTTLLAQGPFRANADAHAEIAAALDSARGDRRLVLLDFGANWCLDCLVLERIFQLPDVRQYLDAHYHVVDIDVGQFDRNLDISQRYGNPIEGGVPAVVVLAPDGHSVADTRNGLLESARSATGKQVLGYLQRWVSVSEGHPK